MSLAAGTRLGPYDLQSRLGGGGMGEVWKAYDPKLQRTVAIKVLHETEDAASRILAEARAASALNHPHICTIYEVDEADGQSFIVMEHVEGKPLSELIPSDGLPPETVIRYGTQIADALAHAHEHGIVHRDLKSANVVITPEAQVKLIDFGIAVPLSSTDAEAVTRTQESPVSSAPVGTLAYMAPEVLNGQEATPRSDIWSLGVLLYEMASGRLPFEGETPLDVVSAITKETPRALPSRVSAGLRGIVQRCLQKEPGSRYSAVVAVQSALETVQSDTTVTPTRGMASPRNRRTWAVAAFAALVVLAVVIGFVTRDSVLRTRHSTVPRLANPVQVTRSVAVEDNPSWSPDGQSLVYASDQGGDWNVWLAQVGGGQPLNRTPDSVPSDRFPSWSPDGSQIAFVSARDDGGVYVMPVLAGPARQVARDATNIVPQWSRDGSELMYQGRDEGGLVGLAIVSLETGASRRVPARASTDLAWSPDGRFAAYARGNHTSFVTNVWVVRLEDGETMPITDTQTINWSPSWSPDSRTLYFVSDRGGARDLWQQPLTPDGRPDGEAEAVTAGLRLFHAALSPDGSRLAYSQGGRVANVWRVPILTERHATWADAKQITFDQAFIDHAEVSPEGQRLVINTDRGGNWDLWVLPSSGGDAQQVTTHVAPDAQPQWSPDGTMLAFDSRRSGNRDVWVIPAQGGSARQLTDGESADWYPSWSPDGRRIAFKSNRSGNVQFWVVPVEGGEPTPITVDVRRASIGAVWSPDGQWLTFSGQTDQDQSYVNSLWRVPAAGGEPSELVRPSASTIRSNSFPHGHVWSPDGASLYFVEWLTDQGRWGNLWSSSLSTGRERQLTDLTGRSGSVNGVGLSTDGDYLYFVWQEGSVGDIWVADLQWDEQ